MSYKRSSSGGRSHYRGDRSRSPSRQWPNQNKRSQYDEADKYRNKSLRNESSYYRNESRSNKSYESSYRSRENRFDPTHSHSTSRQTRTDTSSPLKRRNGDDACERDQEANNQESPKKRMRENDSPAKSVHRFNLSNYNSPKKSRSTSLCVFKNENKKFASTPKSERKTHSTRVNQLIEQNSIAIERNLSNNWADILEELEEQTKELNNYIEKVSTKFKLDKERLTKNLETDPETLRKRQKRINFGKVTAEYKRYLLEVPRKKREAFHPKTPNKYRKCSRRKFDGQIKKWRKLLHVWDENPDILPDYKNSIETQDIGDEEKDELSGASNLGSGISYNLDDYDIDSDSDEKLIIDTPIDEV